jgi:hypothetical protein
VAVTGTRSYFAVALTGVIKWIQETGIAWIVGVLAALVVLHFIASWAEGKGWIFYRREAGKGTGAALSNAVAEFEALLSPAAEYRILEEQSQAMLRSEIGQGLDEEGDVRPQ